MSDQQTKRLHFVCGSYDGTVFAMSYEPAKGQDSGPSRLKAEFIDPEAHTGPVTALAVCGDTVASGSGDEAIQLFSVSQRHRMGCLEFHTGTIRHLIFADSRHILSSGEDSCIAIWRCSGSAKITQNSHKWQCIRQMRRHKASIRAMTLHPSKRLAFSIADSDGDHTLRIWSLTRGRQAYTTRLRALNAEGASNISVFKEGSHHFLFVQVATATSHRLDVLDLNHVSHKAIFSARFPVLLSQPPVVFHVDEDCIYLLVGIGSLLRAYKCQIGGSKMEAIAESRIQGKRFKFLKALSSHEIGKLIAMVTSDADGSYVRGYILDFEFIKAKSDGDKSLPSLGLKPVFTYDVPGIRITQADAVWTNPSEENEEDEIILRDVELDGNDEESDETSDVSVEEDLNGASESDEN
ncbi:unnamed protein product [Rodentolepis nana]|uniref:WD_REPEATS_REGION domain-containing protein n=1 Tax=Rodentolepis nana TaxID=102285 RepID=A0A0R3T7U0_RODNA|nr:unnamed protein product [Rodentolepis nana]